MEHYFQRESVFIINNSFFPKMDSYARINKSPKAFICLVSARHLFVSMSERNCLHIAVKA